MKVIAIAVASVLLASPAFAQNAFTGNPLYPGFTIQVAAGAGAGTPSGPASTFLIGAAGLGTIDTYQAGSTGLPPGTQTQINGFQTGSVEPVRNTIAAGNPSPGTSLPTNFGFNTTPLPLVK
jgi:hypothetical protein